VLEDKLFLSPVRLRRFFRGRPLGLGGIVGIFLRGEEKDYLTFFGGIRQYSSRSVQK